MNIFKQPALDGQTKRAVQVLVLLVLALFFHACPRPQSDGNAPTEPIEVEQISSGIITASLNRYIEVGSADPFEQFSLMGVFPRHDLEVLPPLIRLFDAAALDVDVALDACLPPSPVLNARRETTPSHVELLDVGDLSVRLTGQKKPIPTRTFPDLLNAIVGVIYTIDETQGFLFHPGETYSLHASGSDEVNAFDVVLEAPEDLGEIKIEGTAVGDEVPLISRGQDVELRWEGTTYGDEIVAVLSWTSMGAPWSMTCRMRDDGEFTVPARYTRRLPDPLTSSDEELTLKRVRQVAFRSSGLSSGSFSFVVSTHFPVKF